MSKFSLAAYSVRIRALYDVGNLPLDEFTDQYTVNDFLDVLDTYLLNLEQMPAEVGRVLRVARREAQGRIVQGIVESGDFGYETDLINVDTRELSYHRSINDAEMIPFFFLFDHRPGRDEALLLLQRFHQFGIREAFGNLMTEWFAENYPEFRLHINPLAIQSAWERYFNEGHLRKVRFIGYQLPQTIEAALDNGPHREEYGHFEITLHARRNGTVPILGRLREVIEGRRPYQDIIELEGMNYEQVKLEVTLGHTRRTIDLANPLGRVVIDIADDVQVGANGHPTYDSLTRVAGQVRTDIYDEINRGV